MKNDKAKKHYTHRKRDRVVRPAGTKLARAAEAQQLGLAHPRHQ